MTQAKSTTTIVGSFALLYFLVYVVVIIPLVKVPAEPDDVFPDCLTRSELSLYFLYIPALVTADALSRMPVPLFVDGPNVPGTWIVVILFGALWGAVSVLVGRGLAELIRKATQQPDRAATP